tara:strand:- start:355 stop:783 length:429 start_codon:yes stop_codon:yes gene_type:complete
MALNKAIDELDAFEWKKCNTQNQACVCCGELMKKGEIGLMIKNIHDNLKKKQYLWVKAGCVPRFSVYLTNGLETFPEHRINRMKNPTKGIGCIYCSKTVRKGQIHIRLSNGSDQIRTKKTIWVHKNCASKLGREIKFNLNFP